MDNYEWLARRFTIAFNIAATQCITSRVLFCNVNGVNGRVRGLFDKFAELGNKSVNFEYFFFKFGHVFNLLDVITLFEYQSSYSLSSLNISYWYCV